MCTTQGSQTTQTNALRQRAIDDAAKLGIRADVLCMLDGSGKPVAELVPFNADLPPTAQLLDEGAGLFLWFDVAGTRVPVTSQRQLTAACQAFMAEQPALCA